MQKIERVTSDKGNAVVVMDRNDYEKQTGEMLDDNNVYEVITDKRRNPTSKTELELQRILLKLRKSGNLTESEYWRLRPFDSYPAAFYCLPKVHKVPLVEKENHYTVDKERESKIPMRPITSCIGSPTYAVSKYLASLLKHLYDNKFAVKNSEEFVKFVSGQRLKEDELVVSFDVISLFTSVPVGMAVDVVREKLSETQEWKKHTKLTEENVCHLLLFVLDNTYFKFKGQYYRQISGCAMGSPVSAVLAELVMQKIERVALETSLVPIKWWKRYVDDSNASLKRNDEISFLNHLNSINPNIQFTIETPSHDQESQCMPFLDTEVHKLVNGEILTKVHRKSTHTDKYLTYDSQSQTR